MRVIGSIATVILVVFVSNFNIVNGFPGDLLSKGNLDPPDPLEPPPPTDSIEGHFKRGAIATRSDLCAQIGRDILNKQGTAVDTAIAVQICNGVLNAHSMGLGGGCIVTIYSRQNKTGYTITARETAPAAAYEDMFQGNSTLSQTGGLAVGVPGEIRGLGEAHRLFGSIPWSDLLQPTIDIIVDGIPVTHSEAGSLQEKRVDILASPSLTAVLVNPATGDVWQEGDRYPHPALLKTLRVLRDEGPESFYTGSIAQDLVRDIQEEFGGLITLEDMKNYRARLEEPLKFNLPNDLQLLTPPPPSSGALLGFIMAVMSGFPPTSDEITTSHRLAETFKFAYAKRTLLGDMHFTDVIEVLNNLTSPDYATEIRNAIWDNQTFNDPNHYGAELYQPDNGGTLHTSILAPNGDAVAITSTINLYYGAKICSPSTGIILNDDMDDFSSPNITNYYGVPPSPANFIVPGKRPLSSTSPAIFVDKNGDVRLVIGGAGGTKITTAIANAALRNLYFNQTIKESIDARRIHHQLFPMEVDYEFGNTEALVSGLQSKGHNMTRSSVGGSEVNGVAKINDAITANGDFRGTCAVSGID